ncbi:MAG: 30S ribosomal protein S27e [Candidatus Aenigmatarchaeota archaeon]
MIEEPRSRFLKVVCSECSNEQVIFNKPSTTVKCSNCGNIICKPTGGLGDVKTNIKEVLR